MAFATITNLQMCFSMHVLPDACSFSVLGLTMVENGTSAVPIVWRLTEWQKKYAITLMVVINNDKNSWGQTRDF